MAILKLPKRNTERNRMEIQKNTISILSDKLDVILKNFSDGSPRHDNVFI